jgi:AcrR family transcriptional regulator
MRAQGRSPGAAGTAQVIVDAATRLFHDRGYHGTSIRDIAREADIGIATLFHHHDSKMDLLRGIVDAEVDELVAEVDDAVAAAGDDPADRLGAAARAYARHHRERPLQSALVASELRSLELPARGEVEGKRARVHRHLSRALTDGIESGAFACDHPDETAHAVEAMCAAVAGGADVSEDVEDLCVEMALRLAGSRRVATAAGR